MPLLAFRPALKSRFNYIRSGRFVSLAGLLDFPMGESVEMPAARARPAASLGIRIFGMSHLIYDAAFEATSRFA
jgi:hypothetical protein